jgi:hypothetical protein
VNAAVQARPALRSPRAARDVTVIDLLDRLLAGGVVVHGEIMLAAADIDLVALQLMLVVGSVDAVGRDLQGPLARDEG